MNTMLFFVQLYNVGPARNNEGTFLLLEGLYINMIHGQGYRAVERFSEIYNTDFTKNWEV